MLITSIYSIDYDENNMETILTNALYYRELQCLLTLIFSGEIST